MDGERGILEDRVQAVALDGRRNQAQEGIGDRDDEEQEERRDQTLDGEHAGLQAQRQVVAENGDRRAEGGEDEDPQDHGAFVVAPHAGDLVDERLFRVRVLGDVQHREIGRHIEPHEAQEGRGDEDELGFGGGAGGAEQQNVVPGRSPMRHDALEDGGRQGERQHEVAKFGDHGAAPFPSCQTPFFFSASATSFGM